MILKEINKRIIALLTLGLFLLSTNGMVLFYHYCMHADVLIYSVFLDSTDVQCMENVDAHFHLENPDADHCYHDQRDESCCTDHQTNTKILKLTNDYNFSDRQVTPKPILLNLWIADLSQDMAFINSSLITTEHWRELPLEKPLVQLSGIQMVTLYSTFKIAC